MTKLSKLALLAAAAIFAGCGYGRPFAQPPGPIYQQRYNATAHDPYPDNEAGPKMMGVRPMDYDRPLPQPVRSRFFTDSWWAY